MRTAFLVLWGALIASACAPRAANPYPEAARVSFEATCPPQSAVCACTWDRLTRTLTHEEYEAALRRFQETGQMEPRVTRARTYCLERHRT